MSGKVIGTGCGKVTLVVASDHVVLGQGCHGTEVYLNREVVSLLYKEFEEILLNNSLP